MKLRMLSLVSILIALGIKSMGISAKDYHEFRVMVHAIPDSPYVPTLIPIALENRLDSLVYDLSQATAVKQMFIDINDTITPEHHVFEELQAIASEEELNELLIHSSPVVKIYAYRALIANDMNMNCDYELSLLEDTTCVDFYAGNEVMNSTVKDMVQMDVYSLD
ncbi:MAG: hypothetical protein COA33_012310 [Fluviicola sp.]|nr:hypothetical protein [Fluviicola sp.]